MATYRAFAASSPPTVAEADDTQYVLGLEFYVTSACTLTEIRFWQPTTGSPSTATRRGAVWKTSAASTAPDVPLTSFPATVTGWNTLTLTTPLTLVVNQRYIAGIHHPAGKYAATSKYFDTGPGGTNTVNGPLVIPSAANATNNRQNPFAYGAENKPDTEFNAGNYWTDVTVSDGAGSTKLYVGATAPTNYLLGSTAVGKLFVGSTQVYP